MARCIIVGAAVSETMLNRGNDTEQEPKTFT